LARRLLYSKSFVRSVPPPESWDKRPLPNLFHNWSQRDTEIERLEKWYRELQGEQKTDLKKRLRSLSFRDFWSAYYELMTARIAIKLQAVSVRHAPLLKGRRPDLAVIFSHSGKHIWEVTSAFQTQERAADDDKAHELASWLNRTFRHRWGVIVDATGFSAGGIKTRRVRPLIQAWLDELEDGGPTTLRLQPPNINCQLHLKASRNPLRDQPVPIVRGLWGQGSTPYNPQSLDATERIRNTVRKKVKKYVAVRRAKKPLVVFVYEGDWLHISRESLEWALWGQPQLNINPVTGESEWGVAKGGVFMPGPRGHPQNTRLSAVVYCRRVWRQNAVHAVMYVYHHPAPINPIQNRVFRGHPQCHLTMRDTEIEIRWDRDPDRQAHPLQLG